MWNGFCALFRTGSKEGGSRCGEEFLVANFVRTKFSSGCELLICAPNRSQEATIWQLQVRGSEMTGTARGISEEITHTS